MRKYLIVILLTLAFISCDDHKVPQDQISSFVGTEITEYTLLRYESIGSMGDLAIVYDLKLSERNFELVLNNLDTISFKKYNNIKYDNIYTKTILDNGNRVSASILLNDRRILYSVRN